MHPERASDSSSNSDRKVHVHKTISKFCHDSGWSGCARLQESQRCQSLGATSCKQHRQLNNRSHVARRQAAPVICIQLPFCMSVSSVHDGVCPGTPVDGNLRRQGMHTRGSAIKLYAPARSVQKLPKFAAHTTNTQLSCGAAVIRVHTREANCHFVPPGI